MTSLALSWTLLFLTSQTHMTLNHPRIMSWVLKQKIICLHTYAASALLQMHFFKAHITPVSLSLNKQTNPHYNPEVWYFLLQYSLQLSYKSWTEAA